jgi:aminoglycoside phosphotransferase (APT) family kinase protein
MIESEIEISEDLVRDLLREQHPDLAGLPIREVAGGWGNQMWRLGDELAVRMQRMDKGPDLQLKERRWLPVLSPRLPLPVPTPVRTVRQSSGAAFIRRLQGSALTGEAVAQLAGYSGQVPAICPADQHQER